MTIRTAIASSTISHLPSLLLLLLMVLAAANAEETEQQQQQAPPPPPVPPLSATGANCFGNFKLVATTDKLIRTISPGLRPAPIAKYDDEQQEVKEDGSTINPLPSSSFNITRMVWTIEPNPNPYDNRTLIYSYPENLIQFTLVEGFDWSLGRRRMFFDPLLFNYTGEAGVLIQSPAQNVAWIEMKYLYSLSSERVQIHHGFPNLHHVRVETQPSFRNYVYENKVENRDIFPGEGIQLRMDMVPGYVHDRPFTPITPTRNINIELYGAGMSTMMHLDSMNRLWLASSNSETYIKVDNYSEEEDDSVEILRGKAELCTPKTRKVARQDHKTGIWEMVPITNCGTTLFLEGEHPIKLSSKLLPPMNLQVNSPLFSCSPLKWIFNWSAPSTPIDGITCSKTTNPAPYDPFQCTTKPTSDDDILFCNMTALRTRLEHVANHSQWDVQEDFRPHLGYQCRVVTSILPPYSAAGTSDPFGPTKRLWSMGLALTGVLVLVFAV